MAGKKNKLVFQSPTFDLGSCPLYVFVWDFPLVHFPEIRTRCRRNLRCISSSRCAVVNLTTWVMAVCRPSEAEPRLFFCYNMGRVTGCSHCQVLAKNSGICMKTSWTWRWIAGFFDVEHPWSPAKKAINIGRWLLKSSLQDMRNCIFWSETSCGFNLLPWCRM